ncbi:MAG TPA: hypothetical protein QF762_01290 [Acidimicrobiales bacterium]|nr:hypothetical protein [Acidimicrobiales bacterium]|tara:strand:+ start:2580 stop:2840 length:261 start_codon:yes stop_codon:yes gene_type:complete
MNLLIIANGVSDYDSWRQVFDEDSPDRDKFSTSMVAGPIDDNQVAIVAYGVDMEGMAAFMGAPKFEERTSSVQGGVTIYEISELTP